ncbi:alpha/beta hydrolase [Variovorax paradoxus]|nr:alpha/beta hydrolase [Variovorax paradoxus]
MSLVHTRISANGLSFHVAVAGPREGPLVMLLHGFPEFWYGWRHQVDALAGAGYRVAMPDQRGYGASDKPKGVHNYALDILADDVAAMAIALGAGRFAVVGHDWGGMVAWQLASRNSEDLIGAAILNAPHPATFASYALTHPLQAMRSAYVALFQLPWVPETLLSARNCSALALALTSTSRPDTFDDAELDQYRAAWSIDGALTCMLNWYRAMPIARTSAARIRVPVRIIWGDRDSALEKGLAGAGAACCDDAQVLHLRDATHWVHHEEVAAVNAALVDFLNLLHR